MIRPFLHSSLRSNGSREAPPDDRLRDLSAVAQRAKAEAIHSGHPKGGLLRRFAPRQRRIESFDSNVKQRVHVRILAAGGARGLRFVVPQKREQGMPDARCTRGLVCKGRTKIAHEHTGQRRQSDIPCAMALRLISRSPRSIGLSCLRRLTETGTLARLGFRTSVET